MHKAVVAGAVIALGFPGWPGAEPPQPTLELKEERMMLEYNVADGEAALVVSAESEMGLERVEVRDADGHAVLRLRGFDGGNLGVYGFDVQKGESSVQELVDEFPEGTYHLWARTVDGQIATGSTTLSHALLAAPSVIYPLQNANNIPTTFVSVSWLQQSGAAGYRFTLEQGETDLMTVQLGAGESSFRIPDGLLAPATRYWVEIAAIAPSGNMTTVKVPFMTM